MKRKLIPVFWGTEAAGVGLTLWALGGRVGGNAELRLAALGVGLILAVSSYLILSYGFGRRLRKDASINDRGGSDPDAMDHVDSAAHHHGGHVGADLDVDGGDGGGT